MPVQSEYPRDVADQTPLAEPIRIRWPQSQKSHARMVHSLTASFEDADAAQPLLGVGLRALCRQRTNVVVRTEEEACSLLYELEQYLDPYGLSTPDGVGTRAYERVKRELTTALNAQGYEIDWSHRRPTLLAP